MKTIKNTALGTLALVAVLVTGFMVLTDQQEDKNETTVTLKWISGGTTPELGRHVKADIYWEIGNQKGEDFDVVQKHWNTTRTAKAGDVVLLKITANRFAPSSCQILVGGRLMVSSEDEELRKCTLRYVIRPND